MEKIELVNISELLSEYFKSKVEIQEKDVKLFTGPGEHYGSIILKLDMVVKIDGVQKNLNLVAKQIPVSELLQKAFDVQVTFKKESFAYTVTIPTLIEFQKEFDTPEDKLLTCFPECFGSRFNLYGNDEIVDRNAVLLFENLRDQGFQTLDRIVGFDLQGANVVLKDLARFHAVPIALRLKRPDVFQKNVMPGLVQHKGAEQLGPEVIDVFHNSIMKAARQCEELKPYWDRMQKVVDYFAVHPYTIRPEPSEPYGTISHCDLWTSNIMVFKDKDGSTTKSKILDFQLTNFSSPIRDLIFFLFTSVQNDVLEKNLDHFIDLYYSSFVDALRYFQVDMEPYSWDNFSKELNSVAPNEVYHVLMMLKIIYSQKGKVTNTLDHFQISDWIRDDLLGEDHRRKMKETVLAFVSKNWI